MFAQSAVMAAPVTYEVNGEQYVAVLSGWGGAYPLLQGRMPTSPATCAMSAAAGVQARRRNNCRRSRRSRSWCSIRRRHRDPASVAAGEALFGRFCSVCHGEAAVGGGVVPDLRTSPFIAADAWYSIVLDGALKEGGMAAFAQVLDRAQAAAIRDYVIHRANEDDATLSARQRDTSPIRTMAP